MIRCWSRLEAIRHPLRHAALGSLTAIAATFPLASVTALVFRFPIPFGGYASGPEAVVPALYAVAFYGVLGGFVAQAVLGGIAGLIAARTGGRSWRKTLAAAVIAASGGVLTLAVLDWIIGPW
jgi:hypothetical protein